MSPPFQLSIALATRNRPDSLLRCLASLRLQSAQPDEILISDDSDAPAAAEVRELAAEYGAKYTQGPRRGLYANRNFSILACSGTHIRTMDDDHEFPPGHFEACIGSIRADPESIWIITEYIPPDQPKAAPHRCPPQLISGGFSLWPDDPQNCWAIADGASIYPRSIFERGFRFAEDFTFGAAYLEFGSLLFSRGVRMRQIVETYVIHHFNANTRSVMNKEVDLGARLFASYCHSFLYQPSAHNRAMAFYHTLRQAIPCGRMGWRAFSAARKALHARRQQVALW
jgi:glycosyltransferase involved in cell wall biosynthesis